MTDKKEKSASKTELNESTLPLLELGEQGKEATKGDVEPAAPAEGADAKKEKTPKKKMECNVRSPAVLAADFTVGLNVADRDSNGINEHVNLTFEDILGETDANQGFEFFWRLAFLLFNATKFWIYRILAALLAIPFAILWAVVFAVVNVLAVWGFTPVLRVYDVILHHVHRIWVGLVRTFLDPFFASVGLIWAGRAQGLPTSNPVKVA